MLKIAMFGAAAMSFAFSSAFAQSTPPKPEQVMRSIVGEPSPGQLEAKDKQLAFLAGQGGGLAECGANKHKSPTKKCCNGNKGDKNPDKNGCGWGPGGSNQ